jgi:hypothetical protein
VIERCSAKRQVTLISIAGVWYLNFDGVMLIMEPCPAFTPRTPHQGLEDHTGHKAS